MSIVIIGWSLIALAVAVAIFATVMAWDRAGDRLDALIDDAPDLDGNVRFYDSQPGGGRR